jgi:predicted DNA-binding protein with PD1-like motif
MKVTEHKMGRVFHLHLEAGDHFYRECNHFVKEKNIRSGSVFILGALREMDISNPTIMLGVKTS